MPLYNIRAHMHWSAACLARAQVQQARIHYQTNVLMSPPPRLNTAVHCRPDADPAPLPCRISRRRPPPPEPRARARERDDGTARLPPRGGNGRPARRCPTAASTRRRAAPTTDPSPGARKWSKIRARSGGEIGARLERDQGGITVRMARHQE
eukprot:4754717-Pleurochrysis_carterae.AAC.2